MKRLYPRSKNFSLREQSNAVTKVFSYIGSQKILQTKSNNPHFMKKLFLLSILFIFNYSVFGQTSTSTDTIFKKNTGLHFVAKLGFARIWESGKGPLNGFVGGVDAIYSIKL